MNLDVTGVSDRQEKAHRNRERSSVCNPSPNQMYLSPWETDNVVWFLFNQDSMWFFLCFYHDKDKMKNPWLIHVNVWQKLQLPYCKVISLQLIKINGKKKRKYQNWNFEKPTKKALQFCGMNVRWTEVWARAWNWFFPYDSTFSLVDCFSGSSRLWYYGNLVLGPALLAPLSLLLGLSICFFYQQAYTRVASFICTWISFLQRTRWAH